MIPHKRNFDGWVLVFLFLKSPSRKQRTLKSAWQKEWKFEWWCKISQISKWEGLYTFCSSHKTLQVMSQKCPLVSTWQPFMQPSFSSAPACHDRDVLGVTTMTRWSFQPFVLAASLSSFVTAVALLHHGRDASSLLNFFILFVLSCIILGSFQLESFLHLFEPFFSKLLHLMKITNIV